jgi:hypothetical protein
MKLPYLVNLNQETDPDLKRRSYTRKGKRRKVVLHQDRGTASSSQTTPPANPPAHHLDAARVQANTSHELDHISNADTAVAPDTNTNVNTMNDNRAGNRRGPPPPHNTTPLDMMTIWEAATLLQSQGVTIRLNACIPNDHRNPIQLDDHPYHSLSRDMQALYVIFAAGGQVEFLASTPAPVYKCPRCSAAFSTVDEMNGHTERNTYCETHGVCFSEHSWEQHLDNFEHQRCPWPDCDNTDVMSSNQLNRHFVALHTGARSQFGSYLGEDRKDWHVGSPGSSARRLG